MSVRSLLRRSWIQFRRHRRGLAAKGSPCIRHRFPATNDAEDKHCWQTHERDEAEQGDEERDDGAHGQAPMLRSGSGGVPHTGWEGLRAGRLTHADLRRTRDLILETLYRSVGATAHRVTDRGSAEPGMVVGNKQNPRTPSTFRRPPGPSAIPHQRSVVFASWWRL
jgi:hypothetical protein